MRLTQRALNRATLARQLLLERHSLDVPDAVRRVGALQAQQAASPYLALWNRLHGFDPAELDAAFARQAVVKATLMRITLHAVHAGAYRPFREAMEPSLRPSRLKRFAATTGLTLDEADELVAELRRHADPTWQAEDFAAWLEGRLGFAPTPAAWRQLRGYAPLWHAPTGGPWTFGHRPFFMPAGAAPALADGEAADASLRTLVLRYLEAFGPASVADVAQFAMVQRSRARAALQALAGELEQVEGPSGEALFDVPDAPRPDEDAPAPPRLMAMWDSVLLAYADRSRVIPPELRKVVIRVNGDVLPTLLVDGYVAGVWRGLEDGIEVTAFQPLPDEEWDGVAAEARSLRALLAAREPEVYRRFHHWWDELSGVETRLLGADA